jgi:hypothetical protein
MLTRLFKNELPYRKKQLMNQFDGATLIQKSSKSLFSNPAKGEDTRKRNNSNLIQIVEQQHASEFDKRFSQKHHITTSEPPEHWVRIGRANNSSSEIGTISGKSDSKFLIILESEKSLKETYYFAAEVTKQLIFEHGHELINSESLGFVFIDRVNRRKNLIAISFQIASAVISHCLNMCLFGKLPAVLLNQSRKFPCFFFSTNGKDDNDNTHRGSRSVENEIQEEELDRFKYWCSS